MNVPGVTLRGDGAHSPSSPQPPCSFCNRCSAENPGLLFAINAERAAAICDLCERTVRVGLRAHRWRQIRWAISALFGLPRPDLGTELRLIVAARATGPASPLGNSGNTPDQDQRP